MAVGWTVVLLVATQRGGMAEAALDQAAMLGGVVLSAPVAGWLAARLARKTLLRLSGFTELLLRIALLAGMMVAAKPWLTALVIVVMTMAGWVSYACMRAEVAAVDGTQRSIARYAVCIVGVEAAGTAVAAVLQSDASGRLGGWLLTLVWLLYPGSLLPTLLSAQRSRSRGQDLPIGASVAASKGPHQLSARWPVTGLMAAGGAVMLIASGPTMLAVPLTEQLHGARWMAAAAVTFSLGTLLSTAALDAVNRSRIPVIVRWLLFGIAMLVGWTIAPIFAPMVLVAQFVAGIGQGALEGDMDAKITADSRPESKTRDLAYAASARALGGSVSVRVLPLLVAAPAVGIYAAAAGGLLSVTGAIACVLAANAPLRRRNPHAAEISLASVARERSRIFSLANFGLLRR
jgi:hypothetical protein